MLDLDLDLAADLSIDSIKRIEILGELSKKLGLGEQDPANQEELVEQLASKKTLRAIVDWLAGQQEATAANPEPQTPEPAELPPTEVDVRVPKHVRRYVLAVEKAPLVSLNGLTTEGKHFTITDDGRGVAEALARYLHNRGASVKILRAQDPLPSTDGLIVLDGLSECMTAESIKRIFALSQQALAQEAKWIYAATGLGGHFGRSSNDTNVCLQGGVSGLLKTVAKESPNSRVRVVDFDSSESTERIVESIYQELLAHDSLVEVGYHNGTRHLLQPVQTDTGSNQSQSVDLNALDLDRDSVILLTGGARGITGEVACGLAKKYQPRLVLVGRSALPADEELSPDVQRARDLPSLRRALVSLHPDKGPAQINKLASRLLAAREMQTKLAADETGRCAR